MGCEPAHNVVVVGGGLAGLSATLSAFESGANVTLVEGEKSVGGNSAKATSGINGCQTSTQKEQSIQDSTDGFFVDTVRAGHEANNPELVKVLVDQSAAAIERLKGIGVDLSDLVILGGHSVKRTHRIPAKNGKPVPVGFTIVRSVQSKIQELSAKDSSRLRILNGTMVTNLVTNSDGDIVGVEVKNSNSGEEYTISADAVILATGGYSNDHTNNSLLNEFAKDKLKYPTTNGPFAVGSGVKMARKIGAKLVNMDKVQIHPTGFVDPASPKDETKFLAAEALRGSGGILLNEKGERFVNELGPRDYITERIEKLCQFDNESGGHVAYMVLNDAAADAFGRPSFNFYATVKKFFQKTKNGDELAELLSVSSPTLRAQFEKYNQSAQAGKDSFGKVVFPTIFDWDSPLYVAKVTPVIHYSMGGIAINDRTSVLRNDGSIIRGLYAAGEVSGGVHGDNRLGGNSLLECAVFGHIAGSEASNNARSSLKLCSVVQSITVLVLVQCAFVFNFLNA